MNEKATSSKQWSTKGSNTIVAAGVIVLIVSACLYLAWLTAADIFLFSLMLVVFLTLISICLETASAWGWARLWVFAGGFAIAALITGFISNSIRLMTIDCGGECGGSISLNPFAISIAIIIGAFIQSISPLRERHWLRIAITLISMLPVVGSGLKTVIF